MQVLLLLYVVNLFLLVWASRLKAYAFLSTCSRVEFPLALGVVLVLLLVLGSGRCQDKDFSFDSRERPESSSQV